MVLAALCSTIMNVVIRRAAEELHPFEVTFFRCLFSLIIMVPWIARAGFGALRTSKAWFYTLRAGVSLVSMLAWFYGITLVPLATATALNFTAPLFATAGAALILHEVVRLRRWAAVAIGFAGVLVILRPGMTMLDPSLLLILLSAATGGMSAVTVKFLARSEPAIAIVSYMVIYLTPLSLLPALLVWRWPSLESLAWLAALGALGTVAHVAVARAYSIADASACAPFEFLRMPFVAILAYLVFGEVTDLWTWIGAAVIGGSSIYVAHREAQLARRGAGLTSRRPAASE
ncbi:MAG TPA: DMT family transporter [Stellaceae bacterium]|jgi:S-adenosylmethionine uptake transporter|nr:DMT family transporter [Stellaceae bacterium]